MALQRPMTANLSHRCSQEVGLQAAARPSAKLKISSAVVALIVAMVLIPRLISGESLTSVSVQTADAISSGSRVTEEVPNAVKNASGVDILSDTRGVNFSPYMKEVLPAIRGRWIALLPEQAHPPTSAKGETDIRFTILPDGSVAPQSVHLDGGAHNFALDRAAWGAVTTSKFPSLPDAFKGPGLELRVRFRVNLPADERIPVPGPASGEATPAPGN
jgi:hypothetical protein